jgi:alanyl-tRNA synthetase
VRVVAMGAHDSEESPYSVELCGGTHVRRTGDIGLFKVIGESSVASGVRRIEALTGAAAEVYLAGEEDLLRQTASALRASPAELPVRVARLVEEQRRLERELAEARRALASAGQSTAPVAAKIGDISFDGRVVDDVPGRELRSLADDLKRRIGSGIVAIVSRDDGKAAIVVGVTDDLTPRFDAVGLVRAGAEILGGKGGGGRANMAQAGGPDAARADEALDAVRRALAAQAGH